MSLGNFLNFVHTYVHYNPANTVALRRQPILCPKHSRKIATEPSPLSVFRKMLRMGPP